MAALLAAALDRFVKIVGPAPEIQVSATSYGDAQRTKKPGREGPGFRRRNCGCLFKQLLQEQHFFLCAGKPVMLGHAVAFMAVMHFAPVMITVVLAVILVSTAHPLCAFKSVTAFAVSVVEFVSNQFELHVT